MLSTYGSVLLGHHRTSGGSVGWPLTIRHGAFFAGFGEIVANVRNEGRTEPGFIPYPGASWVWSSRSPVATLSVQGRFHQTPGGTLVIDVKGPENHDVLVVKGTARLSGTLRVDSLGYRPRVGDRIPFLKSQKIVGKFSRIRTSLPGRFELKFEKVGGLGVLVVAKKSSPLPLPQPMPDSPRDARL
jgi:hypothetical protein